MRNFKRCTRCKRSEAEGAKFSSQSGSYNYKHVRKVCNGCRSLANKLGKEEKRVRKLGIRREFTLYFLRRSDV